MSQKRTELLDKMLKEDPNDVFLNYAFALEKIKEDDNQIAKEFLLKVLEMDGNYLAAYYQLGKLHEAENNMDEAISIYKKGIEIARSKSDQRTLGELEEALMIIEDEEVE